MTPPSLRLANNNVYTPPCCALKITVHTCRKQPATPYPSHFLQRRSKYKPPPPKKQRVIVYDRDIICLPKSFISDAGRIRIPRNKKDREFLVANKLVGKIQLQSDMSEARIFTEIRSVFQSPMGCDDEFSFTILQQSGGGSKFLMVPELSSSYKWTAGAVAGRNSKVPIYILAEDRLKVIINPRRACAARVTVTCFLSVCLSVSSFSSTKAAKLRY